MEHHHVDVFGILLGNGVPNDRADREAHEDDFLPLLAVNLARAQFLDQLMNRHYKSLRLGFEQAVGVRAVAGSFTKSLAFSCWSPSMSTAALTD